VSAISLTGLDAATGKAISGEQHLAQSVADILTTPLGSRVMRRDYGSMLFDLIDQPLNAATRLLIHAATALALARWEPRIRLKRVSLTGGNAAGELTVTIEGERADLSANTHVLLSIPIRTGGIATA
jgi:phage baseplate assembly protein W